MGIYFPGRLPCFQKDILLVSTDNIDYECTVRSTSVYYT